MICENYVYSIFFLLVIFHDTEGPITKIGASWERGGGGGIRNHYPGAVLINI